MLSPSTAHQSPAGVVLMVHVKPFSSESRVLEVRSDDRLVVALAAKPINGAANEELIRYMSSLLGIPREAVEVSSGRKSRNKSILLAGITVEQLSAVVEQFLSHDP